MEEIEYNKCPACLSDRLSRTKNKCYRCYPYYERYDVFDSMDYYNLGVSGNRISSDISPNAGDSIKTYYGRFDNEKIGLGLEYMLLDEHVKKIVDKRGSQFSSDLDTILKEFKDDLINKINDVERKNNLAYLSLKSELQKIQTLLIPVKVKDNQEVENKQTKDSIELNLKPSEKEEAKIIYKSLKKRGIIKD